MNNPTQSYFLLYSNNRDLQLIAIFTYACVRPYVSRIILYSSGQGPFFTDVNGGRHFFWGLKGTHPDERTRTKLISVSSSIVYHKKFCSEVFQNPGSDRGSGGRRKTSKYRLELVLRKTSDLTRVIGFEQYPYHG